MTIPDQFIAGAAEHIKKHDEKRRGSARQPSSRPAPVPVAADDIDQADEVEADEGMYGRLKGSLLTVGQVLNLPPPVPIVPGYIYEDTTNIIYGRPKCGKTLVCTDMAMSLATGTPWNGIELDQRPVLYLLGEGKAGLGSRVRAWSHHHRVDTDGASVHFLPVSFSLTSEDNTTALARLVAEEMANPQFGQPYQLIVFDTLARYASGAAENTNEMQVVIDRIEWVRQAAAPTAAALILHHTNVAGDQRSRGHGSIDAAVDLGIFCSKADDTITALVNDARHGPEGKSTRFRIVTVPEVRQPGEDYDPPTVEVDDRSESRAIPESRRRLLDDLTGIQIGDEWVSSSRWQQSSDLNERTFHRAKKDLVELGYVEVNASAKYPTYRIPATDIDTDKEVS